MPDKKDPPERLELDDGQLIGVERTRPEPRVGRYRSLVSERLGRITQHSPGQQEIEERIRDVDARSFRGRQVEFSPASPFNEEQVVRHRLGKVPTGVWVVAGDLPVRVFATPAQRARWTRDRLFLFVENFVAVESGLDSIAGSNVVVSLRTPLLAQEPFVVFGSQQTAAVSDFTSLRVSSWLDAAASVITSPPYHGFQVNTAHGSGLTGGTFEFSWTAYDGISEDTKLVLQVF